MNTKSIIGLSRHQRQITRTVFVILFFLSGISILNSQTIYITSNDELHRLSLEQCTYELVVQLDRNADDITFLPDGTLVGINLSRELFVIDTITGQTTLLHDFPGQLFGALTSTISGLIYTVDRNGEFWSYDIATDVATYLGNVGYGFAGDLAFFGGELFMSSVWDDLIIKIDINNPSNSTIFMENAGSDGGGMYGIVTFALDCNDIRFYGIVSGNYTILDVDLENLTTDTVCILDRLFYGAATTHEFKASDPVRLTDTILILPHCAEADGVITVIAQGGVPPYQYSIDGSPLQDENVFTGLIPENYEIVIVDTRGCSTEVDITLGLQEIHYIDSIVVTDATCNQPYGQLNIFTVDTWPFQFSLDGITFQSSAIFDQLGAEVYNVFVQNLQGCEERDTVEVISIPPAIITDIEIIPTTCGDSNGSIEIQTQNGNTITYSIDGTTFQNENVFNDLAPADILVTILDENGCRDDSMITMPISVALSAEEVIITNPECEEITGSATINITNGTGVIEYILNGNEIQFSPLFNGLGIGGHMWVATDELGCRATGGFVIEQSPVLHLAGIFVKPSDCNISNGGVEFELLNVTGNIQVMLNGELFTGTHITGLEAASYNVVITDDNDCIIDTIVTIERKPCDIFIPNVFSPNGDGANDGFVIELPADGSAMIRKFEIFDRWGTVVFSSSGIPAGQHEIKWDGVYKGLPLNPGVYVYYLELEEGVVGETRYTGEVTVVR